MALSWNEIKDRALQFSREWSDATNEDADAKPFLVDFFNVFGISRKRVSSFEYRVKKLDDRDGYIDLLWKGMILVEMKSLGKSLDKAFEQAKEYLHGLKEHEMPRFILVSDFQNFRLYDLEEDKISEFTLQELTKNVSLFGALIGYEKKSYKEQDPANLKAAEMMGRLHDRLKDIGYEGHPLEVYLVRLLFCLFADDTTIFEKNQFQEFLEQRTNIDGSDLASKLQELFQVLNTPLEKRFKNLDEQLAAFPFINGKLFEELLPVASFDGRMRTALLECCYLDWSKISPAIFGSMFQSVMNPKERRNLGAHYTSEKNILKLIKPLFLDDLWKEFERAKGNKAQLVELQKKLGKLKFLDPACGCGNFLVITYRELRLLELEILRTLNDTGQRVIDVGHLLSLDVDQFYGIEYEEFPARIAEVAMWLMDHQMNMLVGAEFGNYFIRLPLKKAATIIHADALTVDWQSLLNPLNNIDVVAKHANIFMVNEPVPQYGEVNVQVKSYTVHKGKPEISDQIKFDFIIGNPPFIGHQWRNVQQVEGMEMVFGDSKRSGRLDYVAAWYLKAAKYIKDTKIKVGFVSTNSITQGEQASILWPLLFNNYGIKIHFAHRTFSWSNEAKGNAGVHVVIIGFANFDVERKVIYEYEGIKGEPHAIKARNINAYLLDAKDIVIESRGKPIHSFPEMTKGSQPTDGTHLILTPDEREYFIKNDPKTEKWIRPFIGGEEMLNNTMRYCLWLKGCPPHELRSMPLVLNRLELVRKARLKSSTASVREFARYPALFTQDRQPETQYLALPRVSSVNRNYIPICFYDPYVIAHEKLIILPQASFYLFGILMSTMHMTWVKNVCGRLKSDYSYSPAVYNSFPFPLNPAKSDIDKIEYTANNILKVRSLFPDSSLADLYDPKTMPPELVKAHKELDNAVDMAYRSQPFINEANRMEFLFGLYEQYTSDLFTKDPVKKPNKKAR